MRNWTETSVPRRLLSLAVCAAMVLSLLPGPVFAAEDCTHHPVHTPECGYVAAVEGQDCAHVCGDGCFTLTTACTHDHGAECYGDGVLPNQGEEKTEDSCTHVCSEESGCVTKAPACVHTAHDDTCGYVEAVAGQPCGFVCTQCAEAESESNQPEEKVITDWEWIDDYDIIDPDSGDAALPFASAENVAQYDDILELLPVSILADGVALALGDWVCPDFPVETGAYEGAYLFQTTLPEGFVLPEGGNVLNLTVALGDPEGAPAAVLAITPAEPPKGTHILNGTERTGVYELSTPGHLYWFADKVNSSSPSINAIVMNDITVNSGVLNTDGSLNPSGSFESWTPIGNSFQYYGTFDGNGKTISGLYANNAGTNHIGLFGNIAGGGTVVNVKIADSYFAGGSMVGGVCGVNHGTVRGCYSSGTVTGSGNNVGGICGNNHGTVSGCYSSGTVTGRGDNVGGVCGYNPGTVRSCTNSGSVTGSGYVGGVCGYNDQGTVSGCYSSGSVTGSGYVGGVCGDNKGTVSGCYSSGTVTCNSHVGGVGGVCGYNDQGSVSSCYSSGTVTGSSYVGGVGGVCGDNYNGLVSGCYSSGTVTGSIYDGGGGGGVGGVCGKNYGTGTLSSCYSSSRVIGSCAGGVCGRNDQGSVSRCYFDSTTYPGEAVGLNSGGTIENVNGKSPAEFASGEVAYLLNSSTSEGTLVWYQNIDLTGAARDPYPQFTGATVYKTSDASPCQGYSNYENCVRAHSDNPCTYCGYWETVSVTVSGITAQNKTYDGTTTAELDFTNALNGVLSAYPNVTVTATGAFADANVGENKPVTISGLALTGTDASRYRLADSGHQTSATASISAKTVTAAVTVANKTYDGTNTAEVSAEVTANEGLIPGDSITISGLTGTFETANAGTNKTVTVNKNGLSISGDTNYAVTIPDTATGTITKAQAKITVEAGKNTYSKTYGDDPFQLEGITEDSNDAEGVQYAVTEGDDVVSVSNSGMVTIRKAGTATITLSLPESANYRAAQSVGIHVEVAKTGGTVTITGNPGKTYDGQPAALTQDMYTTTGDGTVTVAYKVKNADDSTYTGTAPTNVGDYTVRVTQAAGTNYAEAEQTKDFTISKAPLTVTARDKTITYGDAPANNGVEYSGFVNSEDENVLGGTLAYDYSYSQYGNVGNYTITPKGLTSGNYEIRYTNGSLTVVQKKIGISWSNTHLTYSGSAQMPTAAPTGLVNNDAITLTVSGAQTNAGTGYTATVAAIKGARAGNYALPQSVTTTFSIAKKEVTITGTAAEATKVYDGSTTAQIASDGTLSANYDGSNLIIVPGSAAYDSKNVGENKEVTFSGFSLGGSAAGNYTLTAQPASVTASITAKSVTLTVTVADKAFDGTPAAQVGSVTPNGFVVGDSVQVVNGTPTFAYGNVGSNIPVSFTDFSLTGADAGNYVLTQPTGITGQITPSSRYLNLAGNTDFANQTEVWVDGVKILIQNDGGQYVNLPETGGLLTTFTYESGSSDLSHESYPTGMAVYRIDRQASGATVTKISALNNLLEYSGCSIRVTGKRGIRMITSLTKENKTALTRQNLAGYTLEEYGTVVQWADALGSDSLTLATGKSNYAYKKGKADPVFANVGDLTQYTNVLVWDSLTDAQLGQDIVMRPYIVLKDGSGDTVTLYGGCVTRSIGYIAYQNRTVFTPGTAAYKYVWDIIHAVYGARYDSEYKG